MAKIHKFMIERDLPFLNDSRDVFLLYSIFKNLYRFEDKNKNSILNKSTYECKDYIIKNMSVFKNLRWCIMPALSNYIYSVEFFQKKDNHDFGTNWLFEVIKNLSEYCKFVITINDASPALGGYTPDHKGHQTGLEIDLRLPVKNDGPTLTPITWHSEFYSRQKTKKIFDFCQYYGIKMIFNDPKIPCIKYKGHDNHIHLALTTKTVQFAQRGFND